MSSYEDYSADIIDAYGFADTQEEADILAQATEQLALRAGNDQQFSAIYANRDAGGNKAIVRVNSLFAGTQNADQVYAAHQHVAAFPDRAYVCIDLPGHGASDILTAEQRQDISHQNGSLRKVSEAQVEAILSRIPDLQNIVLTGEALGFMFSTEFAVQAAAKGIAVKNLIGFDPLGMEDRNAASIAANYLFNAQKSRNRRAKNDEADGQQRLKDDFEKGFEPKLTAFGSIIEATQSGHAVMMAKQRTMLRLMAIKSPITLATGLRSLDEALELHPELLANLVFAGKSVVGRLTDEVADNLEDLNDAHGDRVEVDEWPNDNQDLGLAQNRPRLVTYELDVLS